MPERRAASGQGAAGARALATFRRLQALHPDACCELQHRSAFQLLVATVLSAQSTDVSVNAVTPALFQRFPGPRELAEAPVAEVERLLGSLGMFRQKTRHLIALSRRLRDHFDAQVPSELAALMSLAGVGRKTANVVLGVWFHRAEGVVVDTHVQRVSQRLGWTAESLPEKIEPALMRLFAREEWDALSHTLIFHGRRVCSARKPACAACPLSDGTCPSAFHAELIGRKPPRARAPRSAESASSAGRRPRKGPAPAG